MSEARALTNFAGNAVATVLVGTWTSSIDMDQVRSVLAGERPFDEARMVDDHDFGHTDDTDTGVAVAETSGPVGAASGSSLR